MNKMAVFGDSISFGYGNNGVSWFDLLPSDLQKDKKAFNGANLNDISLQINVLNDIYDLIYVAVGINDLLIADGKDVDITFLIDKYSNILRVAKTKSKSVKVLSVLPVIEENFSEQPWLDKPLSAKNSDIMLFNKNLKTVSKNIGCEYIDVYNEFSQLNLRDFYIDNVHLSSKGQEKLKTMISERN